MNLFARNTLEWLQTVSTSWSRNCGNRSFRLRVVSTTVFFSFFYVLNVERKCNEYHFPFLKRFAKVELRVVFVETSVNSEENPSAVPKTPEKTVTVQLVRIVRFETAVL